MFQQCVICKNSGGLLKQASNGKWIHVICGMFSESYSIDSISKMTFTYIQPVKDNISVVEDVPEEEPTRQYKTR